MSVDLIKRCDEEGIILLKLPPHTTDRLQPLDVAVFSSLKRVYYAEVAAEREKITPTTFPKIIARTWRRGFKPENARAGFEATGISPFDVHKMDEALAVVSGRRSSLLAATPNPQLRPALGGVASSITIPDPDTDDRFEDAAVDDQPSTSAAATRSGRQVKQPLSRSPPAPTVRTSKTSHVDYPLNSPARKSPPTLASFLQEKITNAKQNTERASARKRETRGCEVLNESLPLYEQREANRRSRSKLTEKESPTAKRRRVPLSPSPSPSVNAAIVDNSYLCDHCGARWELEPDPHPVWVACCLKGGCPTRSWAHAYCVGIPNNEKAARKAIWYCQWCNIKMKDAVKMN